jgi:hypothetical protein
MRRAFLIVGFNNWGKTTLICDLFGKRLLDTHFVIPHLVIPARGLTPLGGSIMYFSKSAAKEKTFGHPLCHPLNNKGTPTYFT